jgi:G3E family GTPase
VENEAVEQLAFAGNTDCHDPNDTIADRVMLNKRDLVTNEELQVLQKRIRALNFSAPVQTCLNSEVDLSFILGIRAFDLTKVLENEPTFLIDQEHKVPFLISLSPSCAA